LPCTLVTSPCKRTARGKPVEQFDALGAGQLDQVGDGIARHPERIGDQLFHEHQVEFLVDEAGALAFELVREAAGADHHHTRIGVPGLDGAADGLAKLEAARRGRQRELHGVHADRHGAHRAGMLPGPEQFQRQRERVVDQHFLAGDDVELILDQRVDHVPGKILVALVRRQGGDAPAFVGIAVLGGGADSEGRHLVEEEVQAVVVVDDHGDIRLDLGEPVMYRRKAVEEGLPVGVLLQIVGDGTADVGHMGNVESADYFGHINFSPRRRASP
jgi:hypothetical protein